VDSGKEGKYRIGGRAALKKKEKMALPHLGPAFPKKTRAITNIAWVRRKKRKTCRALPEATDVFSVQPKAKEVWGENEQGKRLGVTTTE